MSKATASRRTALLVGVVVCVAISGVAVVPTSGAATVEATGSSGYVVSGGNLLISSEETFGFSKYDGSLGNGDTFSRTVEADTSTDTLTFTNWRIDEFDDPNFGVNLQDDGSTSTITDPNGDSFQFVSFTTEVFCGTTWSFDVVGYEDGSPVAGASKSFLLSDSAGVTTRSVGFGSVDEVRFENFNSDNTVQCLKIDDIVVDAPVSGNGAPQFANLDASVTYEEDGTPVVLDSDATVSDTELDAAGDYAGSALTVARAGGADADDSFGFDTSAGTFAVSGSELTSGGSAFATYSQSGGTLTVDFTSSETTATPALVDDVLQAVTYETATRPDTLGYDVTASFTDGDPDGSLTTSETVAVTYDPALDPITAQTTFDFSGLSSELSDLEKIDGRIFQEVLFYGFQFGDATENSEVPSNEFQFNEGEGSADPATTGVRFETDEVFRLDSIDIDNYDTNDPQDVTVHGYRDGARVGSVSYSFSAASGYQTKDVDADDTTFEEVDEIRFTSSVSDQVAIDNVVLDQSNVAPSIDLDTGAGGTGSSVTFSETDDQGTATTDGVAVIGPVALTDSDGTVESVTVTLDNPQGDAGEGLALDTGSPASSLGVSTSTNQITITRNTATTAELEAAVEAIRFQNNDDAPDTTDRTVTVTATDDAGGTASATATVAVQPGNDGPSVTAPGGTLEPTEDVAFDLTGANEIQVADPDDGGGLMTLTLTAQNGTLAVGSTTGLAVVGGSNGASSLTVSGTESDLNSALATLDYQGDTDYFGTDTVTATISDEGNTGTDPGLTGDDSSEVATATVSLDVQPVPDAPTISAIPDQTTDEDQSLSGVAFTVDDAETAAGSLTLSFSSDTPSLIESHTFGGSGTDRTLDIVPAANEFGSTVVTVEVSDGSLTAQEDFLLTIDSVNDRPTITAVSDLTVDEDSDVAPASFQVDDVETAAGALTVGASSDTQALVPDGNLAVDGTGTDRTLDITLAPDATGTATITLDADDGGLSGSESFTLTVTPINDPPAITNAPATAVDEDSAYSYTPAVTDGGGATDTVGPFSIAVSNLNDAPTVTGTPGTATENVAYSFSPTATDVDAGDSVTLTASGVPSWATFDAATGELSGTPGDDDVGTTAGIEIRATDDAGATTTLGPFAITVVGGNDAPTIDLGPNQTITNDTSEQTVTDFATGFAPGGGPDEAGQGVAAFVVTVERDPAGVLDSVAVTDTDGDDDGTLTYAANDGVEGTATVAVRVRDDGGTANGGTDTSGVERFDITVDTRAPAVTGARTDQRTLTLRADEALSTASEDVPGGGDFTVTAGGQSIAVTGVAVDGRNLSLTLADDIAAEDTVTLSYAPGHRVPEDAGGNRVASVTDLSVANTVPDAVDDAYTVSEDETLAVGADLGVVANDTDDGDSLTATVVTNTSNGRLTLAANGSFEYRPERDYNGADAFVYELRDGDGNTDRAVVNITILPVRDGGGCGGGGGGGGGGEDSGTEVTVAERSDESNTADVTVSDAKAGESVQIPLADDDAGGLVAGTDGDQGNIDVPSIELTVERDSDFELSVSTSEIRAGRPDATEGAERGVSRPSDRDREFAGASGATPLGRVTVDHSIDDADIGEVAFTFRLRKSYLRANAVDPSSVSLYRDETTRWNRLPTSIVGETDTHYVFRATSPGLSVFTIGTNASTVSVTDATLRTATVDAGQSTAVDVTLTNRGTVERRYGVELTADGSVVASESVAVAAGANRTVTLSPAFDAPGTYALTVDGRAVGNVTVRAPSTTSTSTETATETATDGNGPGMGVVAALVAIALVALRTRRRPGQ